MRIFTAACALLIGGALGFVSHAGDLPDPALTPGVVNPLVTQETIEQTICVPNWTAKIRPPASYTNKLKLEQMKEWGLPGTPSDYEEDHRLDLGAGGSPTDPKNLWPMPWAGRWGARVKDRLEVHVQRAICAGDMTLDEGQALMLGNWQDAYIKIFGEPK